MRWLADECIAAHVIGAMREAGYDVEYVAETNPSMQDRQILRRALSSNRILLTEDRDFGELIFGETAAATFGIVYLRIPDERVHLVWPRLREAIDRFGDGLLGAFTVVEETRYRTRRLIKD